MIKSKLVKAKLILSLLFMNLKLILFLRLLSFKSIIDFARNIHYKRLDFEVNLDYIIYIHLKLIKVLPFSTCLTSAIACHSQLKRYGHNSKVVIGITIHEGVFKSHAWIKIDGKDYFEIKNKIYKPILEIK